MARWGQGRILLQKEDGQARIQRTAFLLAERFGGGLRCKLFVLHFVPDRLCLSTRADIWRRWNPVLTINSSRFAMNDLIGDDNDNGDCIPRRCDQIMT